jgi:hypothetical protein
MPFDDNHRGCVGACHIYETIIIIRHYIDNRYYSKIADRMLESCLLYMTHMSHITGITANLLIVCSIPSSILRCVSVSVWFCLCLCASVSDPVFVCVSFSVSVSLSDSMCVCLCVYFRVCLVCLVCVSVYVVVYVSVYVFQCRAQGLRAKVLRC